MMLKVHSHVLLPTSKWPSEREERKDEARKMRFCFPHDGGTTIRIVDAMPSKSRCEQIPIQSKGHHVSLALMTKKKKKGTEEHLHSVRWPFWEARQQGRRMLSLAASSTASLELVCLPSNIFFVTGIPSGLRLIGFDLHRYNQ